MIEELEAQMERPAVKISTPQTEVPQQSAPMMDETKTEVVPAPTHEQENIPAQAVEQTPPKVDPGIERFEKLQNALSDRSADLGECFAENIFYVSFEEGLLSWESCAEGDEKQKLIHGWGVINHFVKEIFGFETKIKNLECTREKKKVEASVEAAPVPPVMPVPTLEEMDAQPVEESGSMVEDEVMDGSCVSGCAGEDASNLDEASKEIDAAAIMEEPMIKLK